MDGCVRRWMDGFTGRWGGDGMVGCVGGWMIGWVEL